MADDVLCFQWSALPKDEQAVFYEKARIEKEKVTAQNVVLPGQKLKLFPFLFNYGIPRSEIKCLRLRISSTC